MRSWGLVAALCVLGVVACGGDGGGDGDGGDGADGGTPGGTDDGGASGTGTVGDVGEPVVCGPTAGGPHWLEEGQALTAQVRCSTGMMVAGDQFAVDPLPLGAVYDPASATLSWTPGLDQGAVYELTVTAPAFDETGPLKIGVADAFDDPQNVPIVDPYVYTEEFGLPVLHLQNGPTLNADGFEPATSIYRGELYDMESKLRGAVSLQYPKPSYTLKFDGDHLFADEALAFVGKKKITLISTFDDNSYVRQRLGYEVWNALDPDHIQIQTYSSIVFVDGEYQGLYTLADHVDRYLMAHHGLTLIGNLYKARTHDANFRTTQHQGGDKANLHEGYTKEEGVPEDDYSDLDELVQFVASASQDEFRSQIDQWIDRRDYENWWIWVSFTKADDSAGKNSYHHHLPSGGVFRMVPWDLNHSFGQDWRTRRVDADADPEGPYTNLNEIFTKLLGDPQLGPALRTRYGAVLSDPLELGALMDRMGEMLDEVDVSARRDERRWGSEYQSYWSERNDLIPYEQEIEYLETWLVDRWNSLRSAYP